VRGSLQQDTYIQRARMFGARGGLLPYFELTIPQNLYDDWHRCFVFHRLSLMSRKHVDEPPIWLDGRRVTAVSRASIESATVSISQGEMSFALFDYPNPAISDIFAKEISSLEKLQEFQLKLAPECLPTYLIEFMGQESPEEIAIHIPKTIANYNDKAGEMDKASVYRAKGFIGTGELEATRFLHAKHHIFIFYNATGKARFFYKYTGGWNVRFMKQN